MHFKLLTCQQVFWCLFCSTPLTIVQDHEIQGGTRDQIKILNVLEHLESMACDCVLVLMTVLTLKCYSCNDSNIKLSQ